MDAVRPRTVERPKTGAARILIVGPLGQGVGLVADGLALAATQAGKPTVISEFMRPALGRRACAALVRLGDTALPMRCSAHLLLAFGAAAAVEARPLLADAGVGLAMIDRRMHVRHWRLGPMFDQRIRWWSTSANTDAPLVRVWAMLGWLSGHVALPLAAWQAALSATVPSRGCLAARLAFEQGRLIDCRAKLP